MYKALDVHRGPFLGDACFQDIHFHHAENLLFPKLHVLCLETATETEVPSLSQLCPLLKAFKPALLGLKFLLQMHAPLFFGGESPQHSRSLSPPPPHPRPCISSALNLPGWSETHHGSQSWLLAHQPLLRVGRLVEISPSLLGADPAQVLLGSILPGCGAWEESPSSWMKVKRKGTGLGAQQTWVQIPALPHPRQEPLGPLCQLPVQWGESHLPRGCCEGYRRCVLWLLLVPPQFLFTSRAAIHRCPFSGELAPAQWEL